MANAPITNTLRPVREESVDLDTTKNLFLEGDSLDLSLPIVQQTIQVFLVYGNVLAACFDAHGGIDEAFVKELAKRQPLRVVFRDAGFKDRVVKINVEQIFKLLSPATEVRSI